MDKETDQSEELTISKATLRTIVLAALYGISVALVSKLLLNRWFSTPIANALAISILGCVFFLIQVCYAPRPLNRLRIVMVLALMIVLGAIAYLTTKRL